jgi:ubiquinone biosynthesis protein COQ4
VPSSAFAGAGSVAPYWPRSARCWRFSATGRGWRRSRSDEQRIFRERNRDQHDLHHVTTGYGRDPLGEICLLTFGYAQTRNRGMGIIALAGAFKGARAFPKQPIWAAVRQAYRHGRAAATLVEQDWEALLPQSLETVRRRLAIQEPTLYQRISAALRSGEAVLPLAQAPALAAE